MPLKDRFADFAADARFGLRIMVRNPVFAIVAVLALALGIGANTAIFSVVYGILLRPLPYPDADRIAVVYLHFQPQDVEHGTMSHADYLDWKAQNRTFEETALFYQSRTDITGLGDPEQVGEAQVTSSFFSVFRANPILGHTFEPQDDSLTGPVHVLLSEALWRRRYNASPDVLGKVVKLDGLPSTIIGVMPSSFRYPVDAEVWINLQIPPPSRRGPFWFHGIGRLRPEATFQQAQMEANLIGARIEAEHPKDYSHLTIPIVSLRDSIVGKTGSALLIIFGAVAFVLLIAIVNVANLLLARAQVREREVAQRFALGATRSRIVTQLLTESMVMALFAGALGLIIGYGGLQFLQHWNPGNLPRVDDIQLNGRILVFTFAISIFAGVLFGLVPAFQISRSALATSLKEGGRTNTAMRSSMRAGLVVLEIAVTVVLLVGAGLLMRSFVLLKQVETGSETTPDRLLIMEVSHDGASFATNDRKGINFYQGLLQRLREVPGVQSASLSTSLPPDQRGGWDTFQIEGQTWTQEAYPGVTHPQVTPQYFQTLGIPLLKGRFFTESDNLDAPRVCIISQTLAKRYFGHEDPIGRQLKEGGPSVNAISQYMQIVGVVADAKYTGLSEDPEPIYYMPMLQNYTDWRFYVAVKTALPAAALSPALQRASRIYDSALVVSKVRTMQEGIVVSVNEPRFRAVSMALFAGLALVLATIGIFGVIAYMVSQRTQEIGIRLALGAQRKDILAMVMKHGLRLTFLGMTIGLAGAFAISRLLASLLFRITATDAITFLAVVGLICGVALMACYVPARRAMRIDPLTALRYE